VACSGEQRAGHLAASLAQSHRHVELSTSH
jgi:hypothetical protein